MQVGKKEGLCGICEGNIILPGGGEKIYKHGI
jgi:hypothetical protein